MKMNKNYVRKNQQFEVRDLREKSKFVIDDKFLNGYARFLGIYSVGIYNSLCRHADKEQKCWPSIKKITEELNICRNKVIEGTKYLEFWQIIKKQRIGKQATNRYFLIDKKQWKPLNEINIKEFSEVYMINFKGLQHKLQGFIASTSIVRKHKRKETQKKGELSCKKLTDATKKNHKPYFWGNEMRWSQGKWWVIPKDGGSWLEFAGEETEIEWK